MNMDTRKNSFYLLESSSSALVAWVVAAGIVVEDEVENGYIVKYMCPAPSCCHTILIFGEVMGLIALAWCQAIIHARALSRAWKNVICLVFNHARAFHFYQERVHMA